MKKKIILTTGILLLFIIIYFYQLIGYGISQAKGQFKVLWNAQSVSEMLNKPTVPDSVKQKLIIVNEIRLFAFDSLGLTPNENYTTFFDQHGKEILWVVTACKPYKFEPKEWAFPIIGSFSYKGFFELERATKLTEQLKVEGYDVELSPVNGWSTLGWFKDPILSNMLNSSVGTLSNTLIHELTHGTLFVPDSMTFNENLASFVGSKGALKFLEAKYGHASNEVKEYSAIISDRKKFTEYMVLGASLLDSIYQAVEDLPVEQKQMSKDQFLASFSINIDTVSFINCDRYAQLLASRKINNAGFISFLNYQERQHEFGAQLTNDFNSDLSTFIIYWKEHYSN